MKLAIDATVLENNKPTGVGTFTANVVNRLACGKTDSTVFTLDDSLLEIGKHKQVHIFPKIKKILKNNIYFARAAWTQFVLPSLLKKGEFDVFFSPIAEGVINPPIPQVVTVHDLTPLLFPNRVPLSRYLSYKYRLPPILKSSKRIIAVSNSVKEDIVSFYGISADKIHVVYEGYDESNFRIIESSIVKTKLKNFKLLPGKYFLYVGSIFPTKNLELLITEFSKIDPDLSLVIAGKILDAAYFKKLKEIIKVKSIRNVIFLDYVPYEDLPVLYNGALSCVIPSLYEGFGLPVLESMACGTPVITSDCGSLPEIVGDAGIVVESEQRESLLKAMKKILEDRTLRDELRIKGMNHIKRFSWQKTTNEIREICIGI